VPVSGPEAGAAASEIVALPGMIDPYLRFRRKERFRDMLLVSRESGPVIINGGHRKAVSFIHVQLGVSVLALLVSINEFFVFADFHVGFVHLRRRVIR